MAYIMSLKFSRPVWYFDNAVLSKWDIINVIQYHHILCINRLIMGLIFRDTVPWPLCICTFIEWPVVWDDNIDSYPECDVSCSAKWRSLNVCLGYDGLLASIIGFKEMIADINYCRSNWMKLLYEYRYINIWFREIYVYMSCF